MPQANAPSLIFGALGLMSITHPTRLKQVLTPPLCLRRGASALLLLETLRERVCLRHVFDERSRLRRETLLQRCLTVRGFPPLRRLAWGLGGEVILLLHKKLPKNPLVQMVYVLGYILLISLLLSVFAEHSYLFYHPAIAVTLVE